MKNWYKTWFDSEFYHLLYQYRNCDEAELFINLLFKKLNIKTGSKVLDLACGRGRHAICLNKKKLNVTGIDLSEKNIAFAKQFEKKNLRFEIHDMRKPFMNNHFDYVFSFFTSFGYFDSVKDDLNVIDSVCLSLKPGGIFVLDFMNVDKIKNDNQNISESKESGGIQFNISRYIEKKIVIKTINFTYKEKNYCFKEKVRLYSMNDFEKMLSKKLKIIKVYGNYNFDNFNINHSERMIMVSQKKTTL